MSDAAGTDSAKVLDTSGLTCPEPVISANRELRRLGLGETLELISDCEGAQDDLRAWAEATGHQLISVEPLPQGGRRFVIRKGRHADASLDLRGQRCPVPVIEAARVLGRLQAGAILRLVSDCPRAPEEVAAWVAATGQELVETVADSRQVHSFYIRRGATLH